MTIPWRVELPYRIDSVALFEAVADWPWAVFLDSGQHTPGQARYDIIAAAPFIRLVTRGALTEVHAEGIELSRADPFSLLRQYLAMDPGLQSDLPFSGGAIGYFGYDLARTIERLPQTALDAEAIPDMAIGIYDWAVVVDHAEQRTWLVAQGRDPETDRQWDQLVQRFSNPVAERQRQPFCVTSSVVSNLTPQQYAEAFARIQGFIQAGDCYQVNLAQRFVAQASGDPWFAYQRLRMLNPAPYSAYLSTPYAQILSASPERFLRVKQGAVETKPIKGTRARVGHVRLDAERIAELLASPKDRAENLMIVDLLRNDLSKHCQLGSVRVPRLFEIESFATVHHLVSTVTGVLSAQYDAIDLLRGAFPGGSITGAPKVRAMQIIESLEPHRRGVYCGAIGYLGFDGNMDTNIAIRTLVNSHGQVRLWAGGGIVADSQCQDEYQETFDKAAALLAVLQQSTEVAIAGGS